MKVTPPRPDQEFHATYLVGGATIYQPGDTFGPRRLWDYEIVWIMSGSMMYYHDGRAECLPAGSVMLAQPGFEEYYQWNRHEISRHAFVHFDIKQQPAEWPERTDWPVVCDAVNCGLAHGLLREIVGLAGTGLTDANRVLSAREQRLLAVLLDLLIMPGHDDPGLAGNRVPTAVRRALDAIARNIDQDDCPPLHLDEIAHAARVSRAQLNRLFREHIGHTPVATMQLARLDRALVLLERSNLSVGQIAARLGFATTYHFSRRFAQAFGTPPSRMREELHDGRPRPAPRVPLVNALAMP